MRLVQTLAIGTCRYTDFFYFEFILQYICEEHFQRMSGRSIFTGLKATTHFGRPNFDKVLYAVHSKHPRVGLRFLHFVELVEP